MDRPEKIGSLKDYIYKQIVELICRGELTADTIFTEGQMIERFQVSKSPVREALIQLCGENVLKSIPRCGYQVVQISAKNIRDLTELRLYLELSSLPRVIENLDVPSLEQLRSINRDRHDAPTKNIWTAWNNNVVFHTSLVAMAGNAQVNSVMDRALATCTRAYAQLFLVQKSVIAPEGENFHDQIVRALENHDAYLAHEHLKQDILFMEKNLLNTRIAM